LADEPISIYRESLLATLFRLGRRFCLPLTAGDLFYLTLMFLVIGVFATPVEVILFRPDTNFTSNDLWLLIGISFGYVVVFCSIGAFLATRILRGSTLALWILESLYAVAVFYCLRGAQQGEPAASAFEWKLAKRQFRGSVFTCFGHTEGVTSVSFSPYGPKLYSRSSDEELVRRYVSRCWVIETRSQLPSCLRQTSLGVGKAGRETKTATSSRCHGG